MREIVKPEIGSRLLLPLACLIILIAGLRAAEPVLVPFLLSVFLAMLGFPLLVGLRRLGVPQSIAILAVVLGLVVVLVGVGAIVGGSVNAFTQALPLYQRRLTLLLVSGEQQLAAWGLNVSFSTVVGDLINPGRILQLAGGLLSRLAGIVSSFFLVFLTTVFMLTEATGFAAKIRAAWGDAGSRMLQFSKVMTQVHRYLIIKTVISIFTGLVLGTWVWLLGVDFPVLWGLLAFLLNYIPNIGSIMAAVPPVLVGLIQPEGGFGLALTVAAGYLAVNVVVGSGLEPRMMGARLGLSTLVVFLSLVFWGWVWGGIGMLLSVPLTMVVKILMQNSDELQWVAILLDKMPDEIASPIVEEPG
jgi:AI-2 transport protein TqsA